MLIQKTKSAAGVADFEMVKYISVVKYNSLYSTSFENKVQNAFAVCYFLMHSAFIVIVF